MPSVRDYKKAAASLGVGFGTAVVVWLFTRAYGPYIGWESGYRFDSPFYALVMLAVTFAAWTYASRQEEEEE